MSPLTIFIVEDSATIRQNLVATLEECAPVHVVGYADNADEAIDRLLDASAQCDLAIVDVLLRQGTGVDVLRALKRSDSRIKRVVLTNYATPLIRDHCLALGADRVFDKSGEVEGLLDYCGALAAARS
jgi:two-component system, OmpR family, response regulator